MTVAQWDDKGALLDEGALLDKRQGRAERWREAAAVRGTGTCHGAEDIPCRRAVHFGMRSQSHTWFFFSQIQWSLEALAHSLPQHSPFPLSTTGLDSAQAEKVMRLITNLTRERDMPSVCTLHPPKASIWRALSMSLHPGARCTTSYFGRIMYTCPQDTNRAEFLIKNESFWVSH